MAQLNKRLRRLEIMQAVLELGEWLTAAQINARQKRPPCRRSQPASNWKRRGRIYSVTVSGRA
ncbi:hypothetical protein AB4Y36_34805 [Paraburkholderia sp. BR10936]|uniref:hypothetical protein n=1 Tax=Paraburkholderia sp. BR10936 TaxID=3236993 RepID=UPI0034D351C2